MVTHPLRAMFAWPAILIAALLLVAFFVIVAFGIAAGIWEIRRDRKAAREFKEDADVR